MDFPAWCVCHAFDAKRHAHDTYQTVLRQRIKRERAANYARMFTRAEQVMSIYPWLQLDGRTFQERPSG